MSPDCKPQSATAPVIYLYGFRFREHLGAQGEYPHEYPGTAKLRETNVELREENPKTSQENLINFCGTP